MKIPFVACWPAKAPANAIAVKLGKKRFTKPSEPEGEPTTFAQSLVQAVKPETQTPMPRLIDSDQQAAVRDALGGENVRRRVITVWDAEMIGALLDVPGALILQDVQAIKAAKPEVYWWC